MLEENLQVECDIRNNNVVEKYKEYDGEVDDWNVDIIFLGFEKMTNKWKLINNLELLIRMGDL